MRPTKKYSARVLLVFTTVKTPVYHLYIPFTKSNAPVLIPVMLYITRK